MRTVRQVISAFIPAIASGVGRSKRHGLAGVPLLPMRCAWCMEWMVVAGPKGEGDTGDVSHGLCEACRTELEQSAP